MELDPSNHKDMRLARKLNRDKGWLATVSPETRQKIAEMVAQDALNPETEARDRTQSMRALLAADRLDLDREIAEERRKAIADKRWDDEFYDRAQFAAVGYVLDILRGEH